MREIKFRGISEHNNEFVFGDLRQFKHFNGKGFQDACVIHEQGHSAGQFVVSQESVEQFTGLQDKNGVDIFEGDICSITLRKKYGHQFDGKKAVVGAVEFGTITIRNDSLYEYQAFHINGHSISYYNELEVVGNIHTSPELLNQ